MLWDLHSSPGVSLGPQRPQHTQGASTFVWLSCALPTSVGWFVCTPWPRCWGPLGALGQVGTQERCGSFYHRRGSSRPPSPSAPAELCGPHRFICFSRSPSHEARGFSLASCLLSWVTSQPSLRSSALPSLPITLIWAPLLFPFYSSSHLFVV